MQGMSSIKYQSIPRLESRQQVYDKSRKKGYLDEELEVNIIGFGGSPFGLFGLTSCLQVDSLRFDSIQFKQSEMKSSLCVRGRFIGGHTIVDGASFCSQAKRSETMGARVLIRVKRIYLAFFARHG